MTCFLRCLEKYFVVSGRARRKELWYFVLFAYLFAILLGLLAVLLGASAETMNAASMLFAAALLIPNITVGVRRMHDTDHSGWWVLVPIVNLVFALMDGTRGPNRFGPDPKSAER